MATATRASFCRQDRQRNGRGQYLLKAIVWTPAPAVIVAKLKPVPPGHKYVVIDGEVLLVALATGLILDVLDVI
jgi:hypothetical protein